MYIRRSFQALTLVKTCEPVAEMRECRASRDWSLLALQNVRTGKSHYLVICRCPDTNILGERKTPKASQLISYRKSKMDSYVKCTATLQAAQGEAPEFLNVASMTRLRRSSRTVLTKVPNFSQPSRLVFSFRRGAYEPRSTNLRQRPGYSGVRNDVRSGKQKGTTATIFAQCFRYAF